MTLYWHGHKACACVIGWGNDVEKELGRPLVLYQGSYSTNVGASAGTHSGGGALAVMRSRGGGAWHRTPAQGFSPEHDHIIILGCTHVSSAARDQQQQYANGQNGLRGRGPDDGPRVPYTTWAQAHARLNPAPAGGHTMTITGKTYPAIAYVSVYWLNLARTGHYLSRHTFVVQQWLAKLGFYQPTACDGKWGPVTQMAFDAFRRGNGFTGADATGSIGAASLTRLQALAHGSLPVKAK